MSPSSILRQENLAVECVRLCTLITTYAQIAGDAGFSDYHKALEELVREVYSEVKGLNLVNSNAIKSNFPAVDLIDDTKKVAIQVTNTANASKVNRTIKQWANAGKGGYSLVVIGVVKGGSSKKKNVSVTTLAKLVAKSSTMPIPRLTDMVNILKQHITPQVYTLTTDQACVSNLVDYLDRGAIRDLHYFEGSYEKMYDSLEECKGYLVSGMSEKYPVAVKPLTQYNAPIKKILKAVEHSISRILSICDKSRGMDQVISLQHAEIQEIDDLKTQILDHIKDLTKYK